MFAGMGFYRYIWERCHTVRLANLSRRLIAKRKRRVGPPRRATQPSQACYRIVFIVADVGHAFGQHDILSCYRCASLP